MIRGGGSQISYTCLSTQPKWGITPISSAYICEVCDDRYNTSEAWPLYQMSFTGHQMKFLCCTPCLTHAKGTDMSLTSHGLSFRGQS